MQIIGLPRRGLPPKIDGLEAKYGTIFLPTKEEQEEMLQDHANQIVEQIINAMNRS